MMLYVIILCSWQMGQSAFAVGPLPSLSSHHSITAHSKGASSFTGAKVSSAQLVGIVCVASVLAMKRPRRSSLSALYGPARKVEIIPSVLPADFGKLGADCKRLEDAGVDRIQFDVMDGNFVPNLTFGPDVIAYMRKYCKVPFETQLMVEQRCIDYMLPNFVEASKGPNSEPGVVICHVEACTHLHRNLRQIRDLGGSPSVALNPHTPAEMIENVLDLVDHVLVMTVNPGFGGQAYIPTMLPKIRTIRKWIVDRGLDVDIEVDGGIKANNTIYECADAGANCFIAGSGLFAYEDLSKGVEELRALAQKGQQGLETSLA